MPLQILTLQLGPAFTNAYLVADEESKQAVVIDPAWDGQKILTAAEERGWQIGQIWITHAHFDHIGGVVELVRGLDIIPPIAMHPEDKWLWQEQGGASLFGLKIDAGPEPSVVLQDGMMLHLADYEFEVRHAPGHTPGHVLFYCAQEKLMFVGDVIFNGSIGRTDFPRGDYETLMESIRTQVLTLPDDTRLLNGHGPETTVGLERANNTFLNH
jgi:hydroxyacylglutathione hydrolase